MQLKRYVYDDPNRGDSVVVREGSTQRVRYPNLLAAIREHPGATRTSPPPDENPAWYIGAGGQWRRDPVGLEAWADYITLPSQTAAAASTFKRR